MNRKNTSKRDWGKVVNNGMGGFLNPPTHPEHQYSVKSVYGHTFSMSLSSAVESVWLNDECRAQAKALLKNWQKPALNSPEIQDWVHHVMGYFKNCYTKDPNDRNVNSPNMYIENKDAVENQDYHLGVLYIRQYYPEFVLNQTHISNAYWGAIGVKGA